MLSLSNLWAPLALLVLGVESFGDDHRLHLNDSTVHDPFTSHGPPTAHDPTTIFDPTCTGNVTFIDTTTILAETTVPVTHYVDMTISHYVNVTLESTEICTVTENVTEHTTTTLHHTVSLTETDSDTITKTQTTTDTVPATVTTYTTTTVISTEVDPCPSTCSVSAATVNVFFWPTDRPYTYPSTYVDTDLDYTFTSPSVYVLIPTAKGTNSLGDAGPTTSKWIIPLDLEEVSTIVDGTLTQQLTLSDLGTDCPQTAEAGAIATMVDSRCDPILAAPKQVSSWANPCNACGRFGLFDPPYAIPTATGGLVETTTAEPVKTTKTAKPTAPAATSPPGVILVVTYSDGEVMGTGTVTTDGVDGTVTSSVDISPTEVETTSSKAEATSVVESATESAPATDSAPPTSPSSPADTGSSPSTTTEVTVPSTSPSTVPTSPTASATKLTGGAAWLMSTIAIAMILI